MGLEGAAAGAAKTLEQLVAERFERQKLAQALQQRQAELAQEAADRLANRGLEQQRIDLQGRQLTEAAEERRRAQGERRAADLLETTGPGRVSPEQAQIFRGSPVTASLLHERQTLPETEGVGPLQEPETQRDEIPAERQQRVTNERLMETARQTAADRAEDNARLAAAETRQGSQFSQTFGESRRHNLATEAQATNALKASNPDLNVSGDYANLIDSATINLPSTRRGPVLRGLQRRWDEAQASGDRSELHRYIKLAAIELEPVDDRRQITGRMDAAESLRDIRQALAEVKAAGINTNIGRGTVEDVARALGTSTDPRLVALNTRINDAYIQYRRSLTGVAFGEREGQEYKALYPNYSNQLPVNEAVLDGLERSMRTRDTAYWSRKFGPQGAAVLTGQPATPGTTPATSGSTRRLRFDAQGNPIK